MALKYVRAYDNTCTIGNKTFKFKPWNTKNEKDYLIAVESEENITDNMLFELLIRPCLEEPNIVLSSNEQKMLMIEIRKKSLGPTFPMRYICKKCKQVNDLDIELDKIISFTPDTFHDVQIQNLKFAFGDIRTENLRKRLEGLDTNIDHAFTEFLLHIQSIEIDGELEDTFTFDELKEFIEELPTFIFDEVYKQFQEMKSTLSFELSTFCTMCNTENDIDFEYIPNFLWA